MNYFYAMAKRLIQTTIHTSRIIASSFRLTVLFLLLLTLFPLPLDAQSTRFPRTAPKKQEKATPLAFPRFYLGAQLGFSFIDLQQKNFFEDDVNQQLNAFRREDSLAGTQLTDSTRSLLAKSPRVLQPYDKVLLSFPMGLVMGVSLTRHLDLIAENQIVFREQRSLLEHPLPDTLLTTGDTLSVDTLRGGITGLERKYGITSPLFGLGVIYYIPTGFLSLSANQQIFLRVVPWFHLGGGELYGNTGVSAFEASPWPVGGEVSLGFRWTQWKVFHFMGHLGFSRVKIQLEEDLDPLETSEFNSLKEVEWRTLKFNFQVLFHVLD